MCCVLWCVCNVLAVEGPRLHREVQGEAVRMHDMYARAYGCGMGSVTMLRPMYGCMHAKPTEWQDRTHSTGVNLMRLPRFTKHILGGITGFSHGEEMCIVGFKEGRRVTAAENRKLHARSWGITQRVRQTEGCRCPSELG
jgi:hypothetical protein